MTIEIFFPFFFFWIWASTWWDFLFTYLFSVLISILLLLILQDRIHDDDINDERKTTICYGCAKSFCGKDWALTSWYLPFWYLICLNIRWMDAIRFGPRTSFFVSVGFMNCWWLTLLYFVYYSIKSKGLLEGGYCQYPSIHALRSLFWFPLQLWNLVLSGVLPLW